jgi:outer membrane protein OmpA-like peptidoglycan-associated protein
MQLRSALLAATVLATPFAASAQPVTGLYIGAGAGVNITQKEDIKNFSLPTTFPGSTGFNAVGSLNGSTGFAGVISLGWGFGNGLRAEIEGNYRNNKSGGLSGGATASIGGGTTEQKYGGMVNVLYDFNGLTPWFVPYLGVGIGYMAINENWKAYNRNSILIGPTATAANTIGFGGALATGHSTEGSFAYQAILGGAFPLPMIAPGLAFTAEYRFLGTTGERTYSGTAVATDGAGGIAAGPVPASVKFGATYNHSILLGLRYNFGVAPPPPPPAAVVPAQAPARSYLVFFDWDKYSLTDRARQIIAEAAANSTKVQYTKIEVNGYTDTSGTPKYNLGLSVRRARAVQAELIKDGVPANAITIQGFGDTRLLVPTGPGVREPQNRRVEIIIR